MSRRVRFRIVGARPGRFLARGLWYLGIAFVLGSVFVCAAVASFLIASGSADPEVPDLIGLDPEAAAAVLAGIGLRMAAGDDRFDDRIPVGLVAHQEPPPGAVFPRGRSVRVFPSLGPTRRVVPRLEGSTLIEARRELEATGLAVGRIAEVESDTYLAGRIMAQAPVAWSEVIPGAAVSLLLSAGSEPEAFVMPDFIGRRYGDIAGDLSRAPLRIREIRRVPYPGAPRGIVVNQAPAAGARVTRSDYIGLTVSR